ncbi:MAG TPA: RNA polymerase sigma factor [Candidatus Dormibacteraeota bacterium]|nr:RNA polymerase sigma factor [Candidatus Dormibacteraeota bacterium]
MTPPLRVVEDAGSEPADWETIYRTHVVALYRYVYARTGNKPDAEDITSSTFIRAFPHLRPGVSEGETRAYLRATARTVLADMWRERHGVYADVIDEDTMAASRVEEPASVDVEPILGGLPSHYRQVLELRFLRGYSIKETASTMGISVNNAKVLQLRALRRAAGVAEVPAR